ncbi:MAG: RNase P modulator RnpM [Dehalococcoidia bacterium]
MTATPGPRPRHVPIRTCLGCREEAGKRGLVRVVRTADSHVAIDHTGKANGRGAYLHPVQVCWVKALKGSTIGHALKVTPAKEDVEALRAFAMGLPVQESETE